MYMIKHLRSYVSLAKVPPIFTSFSLFTYKEELLVVIQESTKTQKVHATTQAKR